MIELELQALAHSREGLVSDVGRSLTAAGFTLQRQRLAQDPNGFLLTMQLRGPGRKQRVLEASLHANERIVSFELVPFEAGVTRPHFAASRSYQYAAPPASVPEPAAPPAPAPAAATPVPAPSDSDIGSVESDEPTLDIDFMAEAVSISAEPVIEPRTAIDDDEPEFVFVRPASAAPAPPPADPFIELETLEPDWTRVSRTVSIVQAHYPRALDDVLALDAAVAPGAREASLQATGQRVGQWLAETRGLRGKTLPLDEAIPSMVLPALREWTAAEYTDGQLRLPQSPLCDGPVHSGCVFFAGLLEGILGDAHLSLFNVCCRSFGAHDCVWAVSGD